MFCLRFLLPPTFAVIALLAAGLPASRPTTVSPPAPAAPLPAAVADPAAVQVLRRAMEALGPRQVRWLETTVWQRVELQELTYQAEGRYLAGPGRRFRLDLRTHGSGAEGQLCVVCDGSTIRRATCIGGEWSAAEPIELRASGTAGDSGVEPSSLDGFLQRQLAGGMASVLRDLWKQLVWARKESVRRGDRPFIKLTGIAPAAARAGNRPWPAGVPRFARLYLDPQTLWPHRLEWWGADPPRPGNALLMQMEFRDPVLNRPPPPERMEREFTLAPP